MTTTAADGHAHNAGLSAVILACGRRKRQARYPIPAVERYDGPTFRVLRKVLAGGRDDALLPCILSARFGLIAGTDLVPLYDQKMTDRRSNALRTMLALQVEGLFAARRPRRAFISVGEAYWPLVSEFVLPALQECTIHVASGSVGGRSSELVYWLGATQPEVGAVTGCASLGGKTVTATAAEVLGQIRAWLDTSPREARAYQTWYVEVEQARVAPKWIVGKLFAIPHSKFRTADARKVLAHLGIPCRHVSSH